MELRHRDAQLRGVRVHWVEAGEGPPLVLIHGLLVSHEEWLPALPYLAKSFRCIALDMPGFGTSEKPPEDRYPYTREAFAETVRELVRELGLERAHVCGHSLGGAVALTLAADHPDAVDRLAVLDSAVYEFNIPIKGRIPLIPVVGPIVFKRLYGRSMFRAYFEDDVFSGHGGVDHARVDAYYHHFDSPGGRDAAYAALHGTIDPTSMVPKIPRVKADTLIIWGDEDRLVPVGIGHRLVRELPKARLEIVEHSGHAPNEEHPEETARLLVAHFGGAS